MVTTLLMIVRRSQNLAHFLIRAVRLRGLTRFGQGRRWQRGIGLGAIALLSFASLSLAAPTPNLTLIVSPSAAVLGDTLVAIVSAGETPTLAMNGKPYPMFGQGDRFRALLPTTPLSQPGPLQIQVGAR